MEKRKHRAFLRFVSRLVEIPTVYSKRELNKFLELSEYNFPALTKIIEEFIQLANRGECEVKDKLGIAHAPSSRYLPNDILWGSPTSEMHLFDLVRSKKLFPTNSELAEFAKNILPTMERRRFDKMSRGDIAVRIIEHLETRRPEARRRLERAMRKALIELSASPRKRVKKRSFFQEWEKIIKGSEL